MTEPTRDTRDTVEPSADANRVAIDEVRLAMLEGIARVCTHVSPEMRELADFQGKIIASGLVAHRDEMGLPLVDEAGRFVSEEAQYMAETLGSTFEALRTPDARQVAGAAISRVLATDTPLDLADSIAVTLQPLFSFIEGYDGGREFRTFLEARLES